jgi:diguanylate cyclase (GGDEF)-like protein/PAS domain S-box-containing protein
MDSVGGEYDKAGAHLILKHFPGWVMLSDLEGRLLYASPAFRDLLTFIPSELSQVWEVIHREDVKDVKELLERVRKTKKKSMMDLRLAHADADWMIMELSVLPVCGKQDSVEYLVMTMVNVTDKRNHELLLVEMALHDPLTQLPNRRLFRERVSQSLAYAKRYEQQLAIVYLDCDNFKRINDEFGHAVGDAFLQQFAGRVHMNIRETDTLARWGGDEFVLLLPAVQSEEKVKMVVERIVNSINQVWHIDSNKIHASASIGVAIFPADGADEETLLQHADLAMYRAKNEGNLSYRFYNQL